MLIHEAHIIVFYNENILLDSFLWVLSTNLANHSHTRTDNNTKPVNILIQDTGFNIGPNNVSSDIKVDSDEFPLQR